MKTVYIAGKISGDPDYREKFAAAERALTLAGYAAVNPALLPPVGFSYDAYIRMSAAMLKECAAVCLLPDWRDSEGAGCEYKQAVKEGKEIFEIAEVLAALPLAPKRDARGKELNIKER